MEATTDRAAILTFVEQGPRDRAPEPDRRETVYVDAKDAAKLIRAALKKHWPAIAFGVRIKRYSGGASATIEWTDGPTERQVDHAVAEYRGASFDGMIDLQSDVYRDGPNGERINYGTDYIHTRRRYGRELVQRVIDREARKYGQAPCEAEQSSYDGSWHVKQTFGPAWKGSHYTWSDVVQQALWQTDAEMRVWKF